MHRESKAVERSVEAKADCVTERDVELIGGRTSFHGYVNRQLTVTCVHIGLCAQVSVAFKFSARQHLASWGRDEARHQILY